MAINISTNLVNTSGGKLAEVSAIQGGWQSVDTLADMNAFTASSAAKQNLKNGQIFYISSSGDFYETRVVGAGLGATYSFITFTGFGGGGSDLTSLNAFTSSADSSITALNAATSSYITSLPGGIVSGSEQLPEGLISGSSQLTSSYDSRYALSGSGGGADLTSLNAFTSSADSRLDDIEAATGSYLTQAPAGTVSGSAQITSLGFISESGIDLTSLNAFTSSADSSITALNAATSSYITSLPGGLVSGSEQLPAGLVSGSSQFTSSYDSRYALSGSGGGSVPAGTISSSAQVISSLPTGTVSGSSQLTSSYDSRYALSGSGGTIPTFQQVTDQGATTTNDIEITGSLNISGSTIFRGISSGRTYMQLFNNDSSPRVLAEIMNQNDRGLILLKNNGLTSVVFDAGGNGSYFNTNLHIGDTSPTTEAKLKVTGNVKITTDLEVGGDINASAVSASAGVINQLTSSYAITSSVADVATISTYTSEWTLGANGSSDYTFTGPGLTGAENDPTIYLTRGQQYKFTNNMGAHPFRIQSTPNGSTGTAYNDGITNNDVQNGTLLWNVQFDTPDTLYYQCTSHGSMGGKIVIVNSGSSASVPSGTVSGSAQIIAALPTGTISGSEQLPGGLVSGSSQLTSSYDSRYALSGSGGEADLTSLNAFTASADSSITALNAATSSYITSLPSDLISGSAQITALGFISESGADLTSLNAFTSSADSRLDDIEAATGSYLTSLPGGLVSGSSQLTSSLDSRYALSGSGGGSVPAGTISSSAQIEALGFISSSQTASIVEFDGNRTVTNDNLPSGVYNNNFATSGSLSDFLDAVFFPNNPPSITVGGFTIQEFEVSGSTVGTLTGTDPDGHNFTFRTASSYTADEFRIASNGVITLNTKSTSSMNTDVTPGSGSYPLPAEIVDEYDGIGSRTIYIRVNPNTTPVIRETSTVGSILTGDYTQSLNENSAAGNKVTLYTTDAESDTITLQSSSIPPEFKILRTESTSFTLEQITSSLNYESKSFWDFTVTARDQHNIDGDDPNSFRTLPFRVQVVDNLTPTIEDQTAGTINENSSDGTNVGGTLTFNDNEGDTVTFTNFVLKEANLDGGSNITGSLNAGGGSLTDPARDPFQCSAAGQVSRKTGVFLNSDIANRYIYQVTIGDAFNTPTDTGLITVNVSDDPVNTIGGDGTNYFNFNTARQNDTVKRINASSSAAASISSSVSQDWVINAIPSGYVRFSQNDSTSYTGTTVSLEIDTNISGNLNPGATVALQVTASKTSFSTTKQFRDFTLNIQENLPYLVNFTNNSDNLNTNGARNGNLLTTISFTEQQAGSGDSLNHSSFVFTDPSGKLQAVKSGDNYLVSSTENLSGSTAYAFSASIADNYGVVGSGSHSITIAQADTGTLGGDTTSYIIESGRSSDPIRDQSGFDAGNQSVLTVSYSPDFNSPVVQGSSFASSNPAISINSSGQLSLGVNISGSSPLTSSGDTISSTITFEDQYGNQGSGSVNVSVFANQAPTATFTDQSSNFNTSDATTGTVLVSMSINDTESDSPFTTTITGADAASFGLSYGNAASSSVGITAASNLSAATYNYNVVITDAFGVQNTYSGRSLSIVEGADYGKVYIYKSTFGTDSGLASSYNAVMGASTVNSETPPKVTGYTANTASPYYKLKSGDMGSTSISLAGGANASLVATISGSNLDEILSASSAAGLAFGSGTAYQVFIAVPSGSDMIGVPTSMTDSFGGSTEGRYVMTIDDGGGAGVNASTVQNLPLDSSHLGYDHWFIIGRNGQNSGASWKIRVYSESGSLESPPTY